MPDVVQTGRNRGIETYYFGRVRNIRTLIFATVALLLAFFVLLVFKGDLAHRLSETSYWVLMPAVGTFAVLGVYALLSRNKQFIRIEPDGVRVFYIYPGEFFLRWDQISTVFVYKGAIRTSRYQYSINDWLLGIRPTDEALALVSDGWETFGSEEAAVNIPGSVEKLKELENLISKRLAATRSGKTKPA